MVLPLLLTDGNIKARFFQCSKRGDYFLLIIHFRRTRQMQCAAEKISLPEEMADRKNIFFIKIPGLIQYKIRKPFIIFTF